MFTDIIWSCVGIPPLKFQNYTICQIKLEIIKNKNYCLFIAILYKIIISFYYRTFQILEFFGSGTAAVISPVSSILYEGEDIKLKTMEQPTPLYSRLYNAVTDIQYGKISHPWTRVIDERPHLYNSQNYKYAN